MADKGSDSGEEEDPTIAEDVVVTKYKMAGDMANRKCSVKFLVSCWLNIPNMMSDRAGVFALQTSSCVVGPENLTFYAHLCVILFPSCVRLT